MVSDLRIVTSSSRDYLWEQLVDLPYFRALLRATEARFYEGLPVVAPVLDLGSGDGLFAQQVFRERPLDVAFDPFYSPTYGKVFSGGHKAFMVAEGAHMPYASNSFNTIISNSVLEHIPDLEPVIAEAFRVLRPGGYFLTCSPSDWFDKWFVGANLFGNAYRRFFQRIARHHTCDSPVQWTARMERHGFKSVKTWYYFSKNALRTLEMGHYLGVPNLITKRLTDKWVLWPSKSNPALRALHSWLTPIYNEPLPKEGAYVFVVARKAVD